ncbi:MAG: hypothetical protein ABII82_17695 [Verrucomicrobiota bacterium]
MARFRRYLTFLFAGAAILISALFARDAVAAAPTFQIVALDDFEARAQLHYLRSPTDAVPLSAPVLRRSASLEVRSADAPVILALKQADPATGATVYRPVAQVAWPAGAPDRALVFVATDATGAIRTTAIDDSLKVFPVGTLRVVNFSGEALLGRFGGFEGDIPPGARAAVPYPEIDAPAGTTGRFRVGIARRDDTGNAKLVFNGWTEAWPNGRTLLLIRPEGTRLQVRTLVETLPKPVE